MGADSASPRHGETDASGAEVLGNIVWHALTRDQAAFASGDGAARRFAIGFSPLLGFADPHNPDFDAIAPRCAAGERFYCLHWQGPSPPGWHIEDDGRICLLVCDEPGGNCHDPELEPLTAVHVPQAMALAERTRPGPFGPRTIELGEYVGIFDAGRLVAMAGERMRAGRYREISGVCTDPAFRGKGLARRLVAHLQARQRARGEVSFLHVMRDNAGARRLYAALGYRVHLETQVRVVVRR
ncbi:MAG: GNAT family N-acetyltransferase [Rhodocyclaceae bacterium]|nr:GNAT family N-acetyltransferase [Rhodocyclaceae bacterium]